MQISINLFVVYTNLFVYCSMKTIRQSKIKLLKDYAGSYYAKDVIDGYNIRVEVETLSGRGFSYSIYVNDSLMFNDGWYGLTLRDIKAGLDNDIDYVIKEYKLNK